MGKGILWGVMCCLILILSYSATDCLAQKTHALSFGYGFGFLNPHEPVGHIEEGQYDYVHMAYQFESPLSGVLGLVVEPFVSCTFRPREGVDAGITVSLKYKFHGKGGRGFFLTIGGGSLYTSTKFQEQGTHLLFTGHVGFGYTWERIFIENRFRHYSNGGTATPNKSINANLISIGIYF